MAVSTDANELVTAGSSENSYHPSSPHAVIASVLVLNKIQRSFLRDDRFDRKPLKMSLRSLMSQENTVYRSYLLVVQQVLRVTFLG